MPLIYKSRQIRRSSFTSCLAGLKRLREVPLEGDQEIGQLNPCGFLQGDYGQSKRAANTTFVSHDENIISKNDLQFAARTRRPKV
jgi:hypothetical protein